jgi:hypothetical protein
MHRATIRLTVGYTFQPTSRCKESFSLSGAPLRANPHFWTKGQRSDQFSIEFQSARGRHANNLTGLFAAVKILSFP